MVILTTWASAPVRYIEQTRVSLLHFTDGRLVIYFRNIHLCVRQVVHVDSVVTSTFMAINALYVRAATLRLPYLLLLLLHVLMLMLELVERRYVHLKSTTVPQCTFTQLVSQIESTKRFRHVLLLRRTSD